jgi:hypothetical protein
MKSNILGKDYFYCILDDDSDMLLEQKNWFIQTDSYKGINDDEMIRAINMLTKK